MNQGRQLNFKYNYLLQFELNNYDVILGSCYSQLLWQSDALWNN